MDPILLEEVIPLYNDSNMAPNVLLNSPFGVSLKRDLGLPWGITTYNYNKNVY